MTQEANDLTDAYSVTTHINFVLHLIFDNLQQSNSTLKNKLWVSPNVVKIKLIPCVLDFQSCSCPFF